ncbi:MAG: hydrolase, partial [Clostridiales bacterium]|nr:hydrolase [Clostridiales bacterium]
WVFCKHKERDTYECPGGHREQGEMILETAKRELWEETGANKFDLIKICVYSVIKNYEETFGMLYFAEIELFEELPMLEMEKVEFFDGLPEKLTYPLIQPKLIEKIQTVMCKP